MRGRPRLAAVGAVCTTDIYQVARIPPAPAKVLATRACRVVDGMAISAACGFVRLGGAALVCARVGEDDEAADIRRVLAAEGLDVSGLHTVPTSRSSRAVVLLDGDGQRLVVPFHDPAVDASADWLPAAKLAAADMVHVDVRWPAGAARALEIARAAGVRTMLDGDVGPREVLERLVPLADYAVFSDAGLLAFTGGDDVDAALGQVAATHGGHVGASCGAAGYRWVEAGRIRHVPALPVDVVDTLAAGDIFHGALALALLEGGDVAAAAAFACAAASLSCTRFGGRLGCPSRAEVEAAVAGARLADVR